MNYAAHVLSLIALYALFAQGLTVSLGFCGLPILGQAAFVGVGAYTSALLVVHSNVPTSLTLLFSIVASGLIGFVSAVVWRRFRGDIFALVTFALGIVVESTLRNITSVTGGAQGISGIPSLSIAGVGISTTPRYLVFILGLTVLGTIGLSWLKNTPFGLAMRTVRERPKLAESLGYNTQKIRAGAVVIGAMISGLAGGLYALYIGFISPSQFGVMLSIVLLLMLIVGGTQSSLGPVIGATVLVGIPELLRFVGVGAAADPSLRQLAFSVILVLAVAIHPDRL